MRWYVHMMRLQQDNVVRKWEIISSEFANR